MKMLLTSLMIAAMISNCQDTSKAADISSIEFGNSFGNCLGYCNKKIVFSESELSKTLSPNRSTDLKIKSCSRSWDDFQKLINKVDHESFLSLSEVIGCPDCADGGAEWIEISTPTGSKRVTYEFGKEPKEVKAFIGDLRKYFDELGECE
jgi:hypothetical protein